MTSSSRDILVGTFCPLKVECTTCMHYKNINYNTNRLEETSHYHCLLHWELSAKYTLLKQEELAQIQLQPNFIWSDESAEKFCSALSSPEIRERLIHFGSHDIGNTQSEIDTACAEISDIITTAAKMFLRI